jgi:hypothetical protein
MPAIFESNSSCYYGERKSPPDYRCRSDPCNSISVVGIMLAYAMPKDPINS